MSDYTVTLECIDMMVDWAENFPGEIKFAPGDGGLTEGKMFVNTADDTRHTSLGLLAYWIAGRNLADHTVLIGELFEPGSEAKYGIRRIERPTRAGEGGFVAFEIVHKIANAGWGVETDRGVLPAKEIRLTMRAELVPSH